MEFVSKRAGLPVKVILFHFSYQPNRNHLILYVAATKFL